MPGSLDAQPHPTDLIFRTRIAQVAHCNFFPTNNPQSRRELRQNPAAQSPFLAGPALGSGVSRRTTSPNGPHISHPYCSGRALQLLSYKQPPKPAKTASKTGRPEAVFRGTCRRTRLDSEHFCASFKSIWVIKDLGFGLISTRAFRWCAGLLLNRKIQIFINFLTPEGRAQKQGRAVTETRESNCYR